MTNTLRNIIDGLLIDLHAISVSLAEASDGPCPADWRNTVT